MSQVQIPPNISNAAESREQLLGSVNNICEFLSAQCEKEESERNLSPETVDALYDAGVLRMKLPRCLGGLEADLITQFEVLERLAMANGSAAWCSMVGATSLGMPGAFLPDEGIKKMFGDERLPRGAIVISPSAVATQVNRGYELSGRWGFASGIHHAEWITACARLEQDGKMPEILMAVFPAHDATLYDNWYVAGLKGTGSCDFSVEQLFVPDYMTWRVTDKARRGGPLYHLGIPAFVANEHAAFALGIGQRALDGLIEIAQAKSRGYGPDASKLAQRQSVQRVIGRSELNLRAARSLAIDLNRQALEEVHAGREISMRLNTELRSVATYCTEVAAEVATIAFRYAGAAAVYQQNAMQRCLRDINVAAQHLMVSDTSYENLGKVALGLDSVNPMA